MTRTCPADVFYTCKKKKKKSYESERSFNCVLIFMFNLNFVKSTALFCNSGAHFIKMVSLLPLLTENKSFFVPLFMVMIWFLRFFLLLRDSWKHPLFSFLASGSSALMAMTFQSISPSSIMAKMPNTFTWMT